MLKKYIRIIMKPANKIFLTKSIIGKTIGNNNIYVLTISEDTD
jgi:hypothetical protein